jgi:LuxR family maltose regulon positive regulatory protein
MTALDQALSLGIAEGYARTFIDEQEPMAELLDSYLQWKGYSGDGRSGYAADLSGCFQGNALPVSGGFYAQSREADLLTRMERKILRLLLAGRSNDEIARELCITVRTVKFHNTNLYRKLGVKNRLGALSRARESGVLH